MPGLFLRAAFQILHVEGHPLTAEEIVELSQERKILKTGGKTPTNTMRARLSDDVRANGGDSYFQRVGPNRFGLREWGLGDYHGRTFQKELPDEITVCVAGTIQERFKRGAANIGFVELPCGFLEYLRIPENLSFIDRHTAETTSKYKQLIAYVWLETSDGLVLSYTRGKYSSAHRTLLRGRRSVGFGGHVLQQDAQSLFGARDSGLEQAAVREIGEELGGHLPSEIRPVGVIWDDSSFEGQKHIGVVMRGSLPHSSLLPSMANEWSINDLRVETKEQLWARYHAMEFWSQLLMRQFASDCKPTVVSTIVPGKRPRQTKYFALVGEIANGKSTISAILAKAKGYGVVSVSTVLRSLLGIGATHEQSRLKFQALALDFIKSENGPTQLADAIAAQVARTGKENVVIDGIRQLTTLAALRERLNELIVIYIDCPRDLAFRNYQTRLQDASVLQFAAVREHQVESDLPLFRYEADAILNNADDEKTTIEVLLRWLDQKK